MANQLIEGKEQQGDACCRRCVGGWVGGCRDEGVDGVRGHNRRWATTKFEK